MIQNKLGKSIFECDFDGLVSLNSFNKCGNITIQSSGSPTSEGKALIILDLNIFLI